MDRIKHRRRLIGITGKDHKYCVKLLINSQMKSKYLNLIKASEIVIRI